MNNLQQSHTKLPQHDYIGKPISIFDINMLKPIVLVCRMHRFGELRRHIGDITESSLTKQLRELEADGFITRYDYKEVPPHVEYNLTDLGKSFIPVFEHMKQWGDENLNM